MSVEDIGLKLKNKLYILQFCTIFVSVLVFAVLHLTYVKKYEDDLANYSHTISKVHKSNIEISLKNIYTQYHENKQKYYEIHHFTQEKYTQNPNITLDALKQLVVNQFNLRHLNIDIFLIDKDYVITDATFEKDIGFDLSVIEDAKMYLDKSKNDGKIHVASNVSLDMLDSGLNVYSYSKINDTLFFEMGFKSKVSIYRELKEKLSHLYEETDTKIMLYRIISDADGKEFYNSILRDESSINVSKKEYEDSLQKFDKDLPTDDKIINAIRTNSTLQELNGNILTLYIPLLTKKEQSLLFYNDILMKIELNVASHIQTLSQTKKIFYIFLASWIVFFTVLYLIVKYHFYNPIQKLSSSFEHETKITDASLLKSEGELGILAQQYNKLYDSLYREIGLNKKLLNENKNFIADTVHQIRTPLTNILINTQMIQRIYNNESIAKFIDQINASINMLTNSYEDLAYITSYNTLDYKPSTICISSLLKERIDFFKTISKVNFKQIDAVIEPNLNVYINDIECERIIDNNISNAIKYGTLYKNITIRLYKEKGVVVLEFQSYGEPIKNPQKVFEKSYRENEAKRGLGLGLNIVKKICKKYGILYSLHIKEEKNTFVYRFKAKT
jgi:signal transduction histidine kinase